MTLAPGTKLGPYEILSVIGKGGMGEVYRARDSRLGRDVAIKVLPEAAASDAARLKRFEQEARSASALNHPNIVTIYDVGREGDVSYIAMERIEGVSLRDRLAGGLMPLRGALDVGSQLAAGLAQAHAAGLVHRDLKPENVMITDEGLVKILDFGLAKLSTASPPDEGASQSPTETRATEPGVILGTVGYMSPEQAAGRTVDFRSDQFSLGVTLYEMASGVRAFHRSTAVETLTAILTADPPPLGAVRPDTPETLRTIVSRCLRKEPDERYASTRDLARDLSELREHVALPVASSAPMHGRGPRRRRSVVTAAGVLLLAIAAASVWMARRGHETARVPAAGESSIAILPFQNVGGQPGDEYFSDGMTESLITDLARVKGLLVIARNSVFAYKGRNVDVRKIGEDLHVRYVLEGSVQRRSDSMRVNAQLIDTTTGFHAWAEKYDRPARDLFALQDELSRRIVEALRITLRPAPSAGARTLSAPDGEAYDAYLKGQFYANKHSRADKDKSIPFYENAVRIDPGFAEGWASLSIEYARKSFEQDPDRKWEEKGFVAIERALAIDPGLALAYQARGSLSWTLANGFPHDKAAADLHRAIELSPGLAGAHSALASLYYHVGLLDKALGEYAVALKLDPLDRDSLYRIARIHLYQGKYAEALTELEANFPADFQRPIALAHLGRTREATALVAGVTGTLKRADRPADIASSLAVLLALGEDIAGAETEIATAARDGQGRSHFHHASYNLATASALMHRKKEALEWLERTAQGGMPCYPLFEKDPFLDSLRGDPDFQAFLSRQRASWERFSKSL